MTRHVAGLILLWLALFGLLWMGLRWMRSVDLVEFVRYLRYNIPGTYMAFIAENTFALITGFLILSLVVFGWLGIPLRPIPLLLLPAHLLMMRVVWEIMRSWYGYLWWTYSGLAAIDLASRSIGNKVLMRGRPWNYVHPWVRAGKMLFVGASLSYYLGWTVLHQEPLKYHPLTPTFISGPLCDRNAASESFDQWLRKDYARIHERMLHPQTPDQDRRILVFHTSEDGLGNRIQGLLSTFLMACLLGRAFLVDWQAAQGESEARWEDLFGTPPWSRGIDIARLYKLPSSRTVSEYWEYGRHWVPYCRACPIRPLPSPDGIWDQLLCHPDLGVPANRPVHRIISTLWFAPAIQRNPYFRSRICRWREAAAEGNLFGALFKAVLVLAPALRQKVDQYMREQHFKNRYIIGMHLRLKEGSSIDQLTKQTILRCASQLESLYRGGKPVYWFIATDDLAAGKELAEQMRNQNFQPLIIPLDETNGTRRAVAGIQAALMEMWLLGEADELIISPYSTFSYVAHGRTGLTPHIATRDGKCFKTLSSQPCTLYWFGMTLAPCFKAETMFTSEMINNEDCWM